MPKLAKDVEDKIIELIDKGYKDAEISRKTGKHRTTVAKRREAHLKKKPDTKNPKTETEKPVQQEHTDSHPLDSQIYELMRHQGLKSREMAISQAIETQNAFNPYVLNHGMSSPKELVKFFEDELRNERDNFADLKIDLNMEKRISRSLFEDEIEKVLELEATIANLKEVGEERYEEGKNDYALLVYCTSCGESITLTPGTETHRRIIEFCGDLGIMHSDCVPRYKRIYA